MTGDEGRPEGEGSDRVVSPISDVLRAVGSRPGCDPDRNRGLTLDDLRRGIERAEEDDRRRAHESVARTRQFMASIPKALHEHPDVVYAAAIVSIGIPIHPRDAEDIRSRVTKLVEAHRSTLDA